MYTDPYDGEFYFGNVLIRERSVPSDQFQPFGYPACLDGIAYVQLFQDILPMPVYRIYADREGGSNLFAHHALFY